MSADNTQHGHGHGGAGGSGAHAASSSAELDPSASASASMSMPDAMIGTVLDNRYRILAKLGEGGMGVVYAAEHIHIEKRVAIKLLRREIVTNEEAVKRFRQEARSASSIGHKNIISIEDFGTLEDGRIYLCMELLDGQPLNDMIDGVQLSPERLLNILIQTGHGLAAAHAKNIVHRDMKPENIFVTHGQGGQEVPKLLDFGIAKVSQSEGNNHLTKTGTIFGTPFYMAPEQALGQGVDHRADIYAMGVIMYEVFCGAVPFQGDSFMGILTQHITAEPKPPPVMAAEHGRTLPHGIEEVIIRAMKKEPEDRYPDMDALVAALVQCYRGLAGSGMSSYMEAHIPPQSAMMAAASYPSTTPAPFIPGVTPPPGHPVSSPLAVADTASGPASLASMSPSASMPAFDFPKRKSGAGTIIAILAVLAVVGGGVAFLVMSGGDDKNEVATGPETGPATGPETGPATGPETGPATGPETGPATGPETGPVTPVLQPVTVLINSKPQGADIFQDDMRIGTTPYNVKVIPGEPLELVLKRKNYKDLPLSVDGQKGRVEIKLEKKKTTTKPKDHGTDSGDSGGKKPDPNQLEDGVLGGDSSMLE